MLNLMPLAFAAANSIFILRNARAGIAMYFALALISPHAHFGAVTVSYEILAFPTVLLVLLTSSSKVGLRRLHFLLLGYLALIVTSSFLSIATDGTSMEWFRLISMIRYVVLVVMADSFLDRKTVGKVLLFVVVVNLFASGVQMLVPESVGSFHKMYGKSSQVVLSGFVELGYISRAVGTFGSPVNLAAFCLVVLSIFFARFLNNDRGPATVVGILSSLVTGILSITKLFILGVPAIIVRLPRLSFFSGHIHRLHRQKHSNQNGRRAGFRIH